MKKLKSKITILSFSLLILLSLSCKKDPPIPEPTGPVMPPLTHQGLNTFGCYIDGELFVANEGWSVWDLPPVSGSYNEVEKKLALQACRYINEESGESDDLRFLSDITDAEGVYHYRYNEDYGSIGYVNWHGDRCNYRYLPGMPDHGKLTITYLNEEENIIAGTFYINLYNPDCEGDTLMKITDGRFDFRY